MINHLIFFICFIVPDLRPKDNIMKNKLSFLPQVEAALAFIAGIEVSADLEELEAGRAFYKGFIPMAGAAENVYQIEDRLIPSLQDQQEIGIRIYRPSAQENLPAVVYFHGGWFIAGGLDTHDRPLRSLANLSAAVIVSIDYRLAPEFSFPYGINDCYDALLWIVANAAELGIDSNRIALAGDSAGGALAAVTSRRAVMEGGPKIAGQVLIYPVTDSSLGTPSWKEFAEGPNLTLEGAEQAWNCYTPKVGDSIRPDASPLMADDLSELPPTHIIMAEYDPLRDEAALYAKKLKAAGVILTETTYGGMVHGFFQMGGLIDQGNEAIKEVAGVLRSYLKMTEA